jgi:hypothetical protein
MQELITRRELAKLMNRSEQWIAVLMAERGAPTPVDLGKHYQSGREPFQYDKESTLDWAKKRIGRKTPKSEPIRFNSTIHQIFRNTNANR